MTLPTHRMLEIEKEYGEEEDAEKEGFLPRSGATTEASVSLSSRKTMNIMRVGTVVVVFIIVCLYGFSKDVNEEQVADVLFKNTTTDMERSETTTTDRVEATTTEVDAPVEAPKQVSTTNAPTNIPITPTTAPPTAPGFGKPKAYSSETYIRRGKVLSEEEQAKVDQQWGRWTLETRTNPNLPTGYPNNDVPRTAFPPGSWQTDPEYLQDFLKASVDYLQVAREAMLQEYGHSKYDEPDVDFEDRSYMFNLTLLPEHFNRKSTNRNAGEASYETLLALRKRLLHAVVTESEFRFVMGGHSAAAGHGNHFQQSYTLQVQKVMEPIMARLGVYFIAHNFGMGGLGTLQNSLGARDLYGRCDVLMWDSGMTERDKPSLDTFARMGLLTSQPILWGNPDQQYSDIGAGNIDTDLGTYNMPKTNLSQLESTPFWALYLNCDEEDHNVCFERRYDTHCWVDREDGLEPPKKQSTRPGGQAGWHPGNRHHQLRGRVIAWQLVTQLYEAIKMWYETPNYALDDAAWHITEDMEKIREGVLRIRDSPCTTLNLPTRLCDIPLRARSDMSPRRDPARTSIRTIIKEGVQIPQAKPNLYDPPDAYNPSLFHPGIDIVHILQNGIDYQPNKARRTAVQESFELERQLSQVQRAPITSGLEPGQGWALNARTNPDTCDGTWDSFCGRDGGDTCMLNGHNDHRGGLYFDSFSGWMVLNLDKVRHGIVVIRMEYWGGNNLVTTKGWECVNNKGCDQKEEDSSVRGRSLKGPPFECFDFQFEFAIDGKITSWNHDEWEAHRKDPQRVVPLWVLLDEENWKEERDVEVAIRLTNCGRRNVFQLSHVYWA